MVSLLEVSTLAAEVSLNKNFVSGLFTTFSVLGFFSFLEDFVL